ncbi:hypothetical protein MRX96_057049 [Rhipicephalus microplus]
MALTTLEEETPFSEVAGMGLSSGNTGYGTSAVGTASGNVGLSPNDLAVGKQCQRNEEYKKCVSGSCREWRCNYLRKGWPDACTLDCVSGCFCKRGYFRNYRRKCVLGYRCFQEIIPYGSKLQE